MAYSHIYRVVSVTEDDTRVPCQNKFVKDISMNYVERDTYGMYNTPTSGGSGPGPELMGADTLNGNDVYNQT